MEVGADVWYKCKTDGWSPATIINKVESAGQSKFTVSKNKTKEEFIVVVNKDAEVDNMKLMNTAEESEVENLINLPFLHEPAILHCLELRYFRSQIYTYTGPILIAVNPFKKVDLYSDQLLAKYYNSGLSKAQGVTEVGPPLSPHPYAIADAAYRLMLGAIQSSYGTAAVVANQSILISGESGAGKTESTKIVLRYLTTVASETLQFAALEGTVMDKVLKSNPILEALGNAKTIRNDNSSRFGKFIELNFDKYGHLIGGFIRTYLLEKIRLTTQQTNERCFHIFYQLGAGGSAEEKARWSVTTMEDFTYANQGKAVVVEKLDDKAEYQDMRRALDTLRFQPDEQVAMLDIIAGILHLGQIKFSPDKDGEGSELSKDANNGKALETALKLLGLPSKQFVTAVTERTIIARNEKYQKKLTSLQASDARDSMSRVIYGKLFDWVVATINKEIKTVDRSAVRSDIGVLDIFGFECLKENSFEQLCINYTNETLQQQFNQFVFKMEQEEYTREAIEWSFVSFPDNQDCIDLIDMKKKSIFAVLDDECLLASGTDAKFAARMIVELGEYERFSVSPAQKIAQQFSINHYAGEVVYFTQSFVDKNRDELPKEATELMGMSSLPLLQYIFSPANIPPLDESETVSGAAKTGRNALGSPTICTQFKLQLTSLMSKIQATKPHYIRCLKPNDQNKPDLLNRVRTTEQLRYGGVLEAVRVARSGFPVRLSHEEFYGRYRPLANPFNAAASKLPRYITGQPKSEVLNLCQTLLQFMWDDSVPKLTGTEKNYTQLMRKLAKAEIWKGKASKVDQNSIQLGKTKVFFRKQAHDHFEGRRSRILVTHATAMQAAIRGWLARVRYRKSLLAILRLQIAIRYFLFHRKFVKKRRLNAAVTIQKYYRCHLHYRRFKAFQSAILSIQKSYRGILARRVVAEMLRDKYATKLQANMRCMVARHRYKRYLSALVQIQNKFRCKIAKRKLRDLRIAARDIGNLKDNNEAMKKEIEMLKLAAQQESARLKAIQAEEEEAKLKEITVKASDEISTLKSKLDEHNLTKNELEAKLAQVEAALVAEMKARNDLELLVEQKDLQIKAQLASGGAQTSDATEMHQRSMAVLHHTPSNSYDSSEVIAAAVASGEPIDEKKLAQILSGYIPLPEHERIVKTLNDEAIVLRKTIANSGDAQHELLKQFQKRKSSLDEGKSPRQEKRKTYEDDGNGYMPGSLSRQASGENRLSRAVSGEPGRLSRQVSGSNPSPLKKSSSVKDSELNRALSGDPEHAEFLRHVSFRDGKVPTATDLMRTLKTEEGQNALLQSEYGNDVPASVALTKKKSMSSESPTDDELGYRASPHPDHYVPKKTASVASIVEESAVGSVYKEVEAHALRARFDQNLEVFKNRLVEGFPIVVYTPENPASECNIELERPVLLKFTPPPRRFSLFARKMVNIAPVSVFDISEITTGMSRDAQRIFSDISDGQRSEGCFVTINYSARNAGNGDKLSKFMLLRFSSQTDRNTFVSGIRSFISEIQIKMNATPMTSAQNTPNPKRTSFSPTAARAAGDDETSIRANYELLIVQLFVLSNDLNEREQEIIEMKKREEILHQHYASKEKMYEQDAIVRMQLGKRLEQILMDKEEVKDQLELCKAQLNQINHLVSGKTTMTPIANSPLVLSGPRETTDDLNSSSGFNSPVKALDI